MRRQAAIVLTAAVILAGCSTGGKAEAPAQQAGITAAQTTEGTSAGETEGSADGTKQGGRTFAVVVHSTQSTYWQTLKMGAEAAAAESGDSIYFTAPINGSADINGQVDVMQNCINMKVAGILLAAADVDALVPITETAISSGIPVVAVDSGLNTDKYSSFIATDNKKAGAQLAEKVIEEIGETGKIAVINYAAGVQTGALREAGFREVMEKYPDIQLLETQYYNNDTQKALELSQNLLTANPDLKAVFATNEYGIVGACRALMEKNINTVKVYGFDFSDDILPLLKNQYCAGTVVQKPYDMGYTGVKTLLEVLDGKEPQKDIDSGCVIATPENYENEDIYNVLYPLGKE